MTLDVRSLPERVQDILGRGRLSGRGPLGAPIHDSDEAPAQSARRCGEGVVRRLTALDDSAAAGLVDRPLLCAWTGDTT